MSTPGSDVSEGAIPPDATYEELTAMLEEVVEVLERGDLPLDQALAAYEQGVTLVRRCNDLLDRAELRVSELTIDLAGGRAADGAGLKTASLFDVEVEDEDEDEDDEE